MQTKEFYLITASSLWNIVSGILIAVLGGSLLSIITSRLRLLRELILPIMTVIKATPVASFIVLAMIWIGAAKVPAFITVLIVLPVIWTNLDEGFSSIDPKLNEVTRVYQMSFGKRLKFLILPSLKPYFVSACRTSLGLAWKAGIAAEILATPDHSIGKELYFSKTYLETPTLFAWTLVVILLSLLIEKLLVYALERLGQRLRMTPKGADHVKA
jgi:NitT/TauT family transport system permease protein